MVECLALLGLFSVSICCRWDEPDANRSSRDGRLPVSAPTNIFDGKNRIFLVLPLVFLLVRVMFSYRRKDMLRTSNSRHTLPSQTRNNPHPHKITHFSSTTSNSLSLSIKTRFNTGISQHLHLHLRSQLVPSMLLQQRSRS